MPPDPRRCAAAPRCARPAALLPVVVFPPSRHDRDQTPARVRVDAVPLCEPCAERTGRGHPAEFLGVRQVREVALRVALGSKRPPFDHEAARFAFEPIALETPGSSQ